MSEALTGIPTYPSSVTFPTAGEDVSAADLRDRYGQPVLNAATYLKAQMDNLRWLPLRLDAGILANHIPRDVSAQDADPQGVFVSPDGTKMYVGGAANARVFEYDLTGDPYDIEESAYSGDSFDVSGQVGSSLRSGLYFSDDGFTMFVTSAAGVVYQYALGTAWSVATAGYASISLDVQASVTGTFTVLSVAFANNGTKLYAACNTSTDSIAEFTLGTAWDLSTASYVGQNTLAITDVPNGIAVMNDGKLLVTVNSTTVRRYRMATAYSVATLFSDGLTMDVSGEFTAARGIAISPDGTKLFLTGPTEGQIRWYHIGRMVPVV